MSLTPAQFTADVLAEVARARAKFPAPAGLLCALTEEVGEVAKALLDEPRARLYRECVQVACVATRLATEGDPTLDAMRCAKGLDSSVTAPMVTNELRVYLLPDTSRLVATNIVNMQGALQPAHGARAAAGGGR